MTRQACNAVRWERECREVQAQSAIDDLPLNIPYQGTGPRFKNPLAVRPAGRGAQSTVVRIAPEEAGAGTGPGLIGVKLIDVEPIGDEAGANEATGAC